MNTSDPRTPDQSPDAASPRLPELSDDRIDAMESALFTDISRERRSRRSRRTRIWVGAGAAAAIVVVAAVIAPLVMSSLTPRTMSAVDMAPQGPFVDLRATQGSAESGVMGGADAGGAVAADQTVGGDREIIASASATVIVDDIPGSAREISDAATAAGGYVESMTLGESGVIAPMDGVIRESTILPYSPSGAWVTVRVPADQLAPLIDQLPRFGEVAASSINRQDVTDQAIDLRARIESAQTSVDRLTELMAQATSVADLIAAESALSERQATLESYQQQLEALDAQVAMSTLTVSLQPKVVPVTADPAGFGDGLAAGWNGLVATLNGIVVALGFLLPWIVVVGVIGAVVWAIVRLVRRGRRERSGLRQGRGASEASDADQG